MLRLITKIKFDSSGVSMGKCHVHKLFKQRGDIVSQNEVLMEIRTDKSIIEERSPIKGKLLEFHKSKGSVLNHYDDLYSIEV
jgi:pyruvate/2-oxoglutarate dehydrogenase complex dihydrolipoamide acyltransferase (E2) component